MFTRCFLMNNRLAAYLSLMAVLGSCAVVAAQPTKTTSGSPLHDFLGIDPVSGKFIDEPSTTETRDGQSDSQSEAAMDTAERSRAALREISEKISSGSIEDLSNLVGGAGGGERLDALRRWALWATAAMLLIYPVSMLIAEAIQWSKTRINDDLVDADRRHLHTRFMRRVLQASLWAVLVVGLAATSWNDYWWHQPSMLPVMLVGGGLLCIGIATLSRLVTQADRDHPLTLIRQVQREQLELRADVEDLRKRLLQVRPNE